MVRTGVMRAFGSRLRHALAHATRSRPRAFAAGLGVTGLTQSSTATALLVANLAERGLIAGAAGLAIMLGADVGSTLIAQVLSFGFEWLSPALLLVGVTAFLASSGGRWRQIGRIVIGLGLMLLSLALIGSTTEPLRESATLAAIVGPLANDPPLALLLAVLLTWFAHSSLAVVLLVMSFAANGLVPTPLALVLVLGANVGGAVAPVMLTLRALPLARRVPLGNLVMRTAGALALLPVVVAAAPIIAWIDPDPARQVANFHTLFNLALALVFLPLVAPVAALTRKLLPDPKDAPDEAEPRYLDPAAVTTPPVALAGATRETLRMGDVIEEMLRRLIDVFRTDDAKLADELRVRDDRVDRLNEAIKLYLTRVSQAELGAEDQHRYREIMTFSTNLEHVGDIIDKNLLELAAKKIRNRLTFSAAGLDEICGFHARVLTNLHLALNVFVSRDPSLARRLLAEKATIRDAELAAAEQHLDRLRAGRLESIETSSLHLDIIRDLKRVNSHLTAVAYAVLESAGVLDEWRRRHRDVDEDGTLAGRVDGAGSGA